MSFILTIKNIKHKKAVNGIIGHGSAGLPLAYRVLQKGFQNYRF